MADALGVLIVWPLLALVPAVVFTVLYARARRMPVLAAALAWFAYCAYEQAIQLRILCSGECNIRIDLLLFYPLLLLLSGWAAVAYARRDRGRAQG